MPRAGIYRITNAIDKKIYIGQSFDLDRRLNTHIKQLTRFQHPSRVLQNAVHKYALENFKFEIIEIVEPASKGDKKAQEILDYLEMFYIESYETLVSQHGYNIKNGGNNRAGYYLPDTKCYIFYSPENEKIDVSNLPEFCAKLNLSMKSMYSLGNGKIKHHKNWTTTEKDTTYKYELKDPNGKIYQFNKPVTFAKEQGLCPHAVHQVLIQQRRHYRLWSLSDTQLTAEDCKVLSCRIDFYKKYYWINIVTTEEEYCSVEDLSKKYRLNKDVLYRISNPNISYFVYKNWTIKDLNSIKEKRADKIYTFVHNTLGTFKGTTKEFLLNYPELVRCNISGLITRKRKSHKGWRLEDE